MAGRWHLKRTCLHSVEDSLAGPPASNCPESNLGASSPSSALQLGRCTERRWFREERRLEKPLYFASAAPICTNITVLVLLRVSPHL